jgi:hypothetical protein
MLESTPVYAMNLLLTDDTLDVVDYKSLSSSALYPNDVKKEKVHIEDSSILLVSGREIVSLY